MAKGLKTVKNKRGKQVVTLPVLLNDGTIIDCPVPSAKQLRAESKSRQRIKERCAKENPNDEPGIASRIVFEEFCRLSGVEIPPGLKGLFGDK